MSVVWAVLAYVLFPFFLVACLAGAQWVVRCERRRPTSYSRRLGREPAVRAAERHVAEYARSLREN